MNFRTVIAALLFSISSLFLSAEDGVLDLSGIDFNRTGKSSLDGQWEFYWNEFLSAEDFNNNDVEIKPEYIGVPGTWNHNTSHQAWGYGTMRIVLTGLEPDSVYSLYVPEIVSSYRLWIDGRELSSNGQVSSIASESLPQFLPKTVCFVTKGQSVELIVHISNFDYRNSGIWRSFFIGRPAGINKFRELRLMLDIFLISGLLAISLIHIGIFLYRRKEKREFLFGLICLTFLIRIMTTGEQLLTYFIPRFPWEILRRLEYIPFYASAPLLVLFLTSLFPDEASKIVNRIYITVCLSLGLFILVFPVRISNHSIVFAQLLIVAGIIYAFFIMSRAVIHKRESSIMIMTAYVIFSLFVVNDILYSNEVIQTLYISPLGFVIFIIIQSQILTRKFTRSFIQREALAKSRDKFKYASITDSLTGLYNVGYLRQTIEKEMLSSMESEKPLSVIMADVDNFKTINDTWGHKQGDDVLKIMAEIISNSARANDSACRYGGEEFSVVLPETDLKEACDVAERIRKNFESAGDDENKMKGITVSIGVAQFNHGETPGDLLDRADKALYKAKGSGKNRVELS